MNEMRALIVDDSKTACVVMARLLRANGIESDSCYSGQEALSYLQSFKPAVIFMDHNMPGMDGFEVVRALKESPDTATIPVMMYTARSGEDVYFGQARALGAIDVLPKELNQKHIEQALTQLGMMPRQRRATDKPVEKTEAIEDENAKEVVALAKENEYADNQNKESKPESTIDAEQLGTMIQDNFQKIYVSSIRGFISEQIYSSVSEFLEHYKYEQQQFNQKISQSLNKKERQYNETVAKARQESESRWEDFIRKQASSQGNSRWLSFLFMIVVGYFVWDLQQSQQQTELALKASNDALEKTNNQLIDAINELSSLRAANTADTQRTEDVDKQSSKTSNRDYVEVANSNSAIQIISFDENVGGYIVENSMSGYRAFYAPSGQMLSYVPTQYFLDSQCYGEALVESKENFVFRDVNDVLWKVVTQELSEQFQPLSKRLSDGTCQAHESQELLTLSRIEINNVEETSISLTPLMISIASY